MLFLRQQLLYTFLKKKSRLTFFLLRKTLCCIPSYDTLSVMTKKTNTSDKHHLYVNDILSQSALFPSANTSLRVYFLQMWMGYHRFLLPPLLEHTYIRTRQLSSLNMFTPHFQIPAFRTFFREIWDLIYYSWYVQYYSIIILAPKNKILMYGSTVYGSFTGRGDIL